MLRAANWWSMEACRAAASEQLEASSSIHGAGLSRIREDIDPGGFASSASLLSQSQELASSALNAVPGRLIDLQ